MPSVQLNGQRYHILSRGLPLPQRNLLSVSDSPNLWAAHYPWVDRLSHPELMQIWQTHYSQSALTYGVPPSAMRQVIAEDLKNGLLVLQPYSDPNESLGQLKQQKSEALQKIRQHMQALLNEEKQQAAKIAEDYNKKSPVGKAADHVVAAAKGFGQAASDFSKWLDDLGDLVIPERVIARWLVNAADSYLHPEQGTARQRIIDSEARELAQALGFDPRRVSAAHINVAKDVAYLLLDDKDVRQLFTQFFADMAKAQHSTEWAEIPGGILFEVVFALGLAAFTGGASVAAVLGKQSLWIRKFEKVLGAVADLTEALRGIKRRKKRELIAPQKNAPAAQGGSSNKYDQAEEMQRSGQAPSKSKEPASTEKDKTPDPKKIPPKSLAEAEQRLLDAQPAVNAALAEGKIPQSPFSLAEKLAMAKNGLTDRFLVRIIESTHAADAGLISQPKPFGTLSFTAPLSMVEYADTNAEVMLNAFGTRSRPGKDYTILLIDREAMEASGQVKTIVPTYENLNKFLNENPNISSVPESVRKKVLSDDFAKEYYPFASEMGAAKVDTSDLDLVKKFAEGKGYSPEKAELLTKRQIMANEISIWEQFTGNGLTMDTNLTKSGANNAYPDTVHYGAVEAIMLDKKPETLGALENAKKIKRLKAN